MPNNSLALDSFFKNQDSGIWLRSVPGCSPARPRFVTPESFIDSFSCTNSSSLVFVFYSFIENLVEHILFSKSIFLIFEPFKKKPVKKHTFKPTQDYEYH